jgi:HAD superfamily hydrolase (TIGR01509 family)
MIKAIITDLGGVIVKGDKSLRAAKLAQYADATLKAILERFSNTVVTNFEADFSLGLITPDEFFQKCVKEFGIKGLTFEGFREIYGNPFSLDEATVDILEDQALSRKIILLSNTNSIHYDSLAGKFKEVFNIFSAQALSFKLHLAKPDRKIYLKAVEMAGVLPEECVYIDDVKDYAKAAESVGMKAIHFSSPEQLKEELAALK